MSPSSTPNPSDRTGSQPSHSRPRRVLPPELARIRSRTPASSSPTDIKPQSSPSFISKFRSRLSTLPSPVRRTFRVLRILAPIVPIGIFFSEHVLQVMWVRGPSMTPYLNENYAEMSTRSDMVLVNMWQWASGWPWERSRRLERGMVVTFRSPANPSHIAVKRVIALPGDRVTTREPCLKPSQIVPFNHVWLEGDVDDPRKTLDSNTYGPVSISLITGRVVAVLWPRMRMLKWWEWDKAQGQDSGKLVRERVFKEAVKVERPYLD